MSDVFNLTSGQVAGSGREMLLTHPRRRCGCHECMEHHRGGWTPEASGVQVRHGGAWDRVLTTRCAAPSSGDTPRNGGSTLSSGGTAPDPGQP